MARLKDYYKNDVAPALMKKFSYKSVMQIPKLDKDVYKRQVFLCLSLGLYQSYFQAAIILFMILLVKMIFDGLSFQKVLVQEIKALCTLVLGLVLYFLSVQVVLACTGLTLTNAYNGISNVGDYAGTSIFSLFLETYLYPIEYLLKPETYQPVVVAVLNGILFLLTVAGIVRVLWKKKTAVPNVVLLVLLLLSMPFGMNVVYFLSKGMEHSLMIYSFFFVYVFCLFVLDYNKRLAQTGNRDRISRAETICRGLYGCTCLLYTSSAPLRSISTLQEAQLPCLNATQHFL